MHVVKSLKDLLDDVNDLILCEGPLIFDLRMKVAIGDQFHHYIVVKRIFNKLDHLHNIDMLSLGDNGQLILIQLLHVLIPRQTALLDHFNGASLPSLPILSLHNLAEIAFADFRFDLILVIFELVHPLEDALFPGGGLGEDGPIRPSRIIAFFEEKLAQI